MDVFEDRMAEHVASLSAALDQEEAAVIDLSAKLTEREGNCERLRSAIHALNGQKPTPKRSRKIVKREIGAGTGFGVSLERAKPLHDYIKEVVASGQRTFNQKDIYKPLELDQSVGSAAFKFFRSIGFLRIAGRDLERKCDMWAIMDDDAFETIWRDTFERDVDADREALRQRLLEGAGGESRLDLVAAYIREEGEVHGWTHIADTLGMPKHAVEALKPTLCNLKLIEVDSQQGRPSIIKWVAQSDTNIQEVLNGAA